MSSGVADVYGVFFFQAEDGIRDLVRSRGLGDVYKRQLSMGRGTMTRAMMNGSLRSTASAMPGVKGRHR